MGIAIKPSRLRRIYSSMIRRCKNEKDTSYQHYGERGIKVCKEWRDSFDAFQEWAINNGYSDKLTIDRINNNGNYEPRNCRWVTYAIQASNKREAIYFRETKNEAILSGRKLSEKEEKLFKLQSKIKHYFIDTKQNVRKFCKEIRASEGAYYNYFFKGRRPEYDIAKRIVAATKNHITMKELGYDD